MKCTRAFRVRPPHWGSRPAFTLIELLVVISIVALLMAVLLPTLARVRKQARGVRCQANLKQWGAVLAVYMAENEDLLPWSTMSPGNRGGGWCWGEPLVAYWDGARAVYYDPPRWSTGRYRGMLTCPAASTPANTTGKGNAVGGTFLAWGLGLQADAKESPYLRGFGSYGWNAPLSGLAASPEGSSDGEGYWRPQDIRYRATIPVILDSAWRYGWISALDPPPPYDAIPTWTPVPWHNHNSLCVNFRTF
jgi:prepilin-type N-terminal cleavage/methylation domain-containing protein